MEENSVWRAHRWSACRSHMESLVPFRPRRVKPRAGSSAPAILPGPRQASTQSSIAARFTNPDSSPLTPQNALRRPRRTPRLPRRPRTVSSPRPRSSKRRRRNHGVPSTRIPSAGPAATRAASLVHTSAGTRGQGATKGHGRREPSVGQQGGQTTAGSRQSARREPSRLRSFSPSSVVSLFASLRLSLSLFIISLQQQRKAVGGLGPRFARSNVATGPAPGF